MYSGEATVTNDQLEGVLKAGDILRVRGLWRSNSGSKKENIQSNNQKVERDKRGEQPITGQIQKIKLVQPTTEKIDSTMTMTTTAATPPPTAQPVSVVQSAMTTMAMATATTTTATTTMTMPSVPAQKLTEKKSSERMLEEKTSEITAFKNVIDGTKSNDQNKNKENVEANGKKKRSSNSEAESTKSKSDTGDSELNLELLVKDEPIDWEDSMDPTESLTIDHDIDIKPVS